MIAIEQRCPDGTTLPRQPSSTTAKEELPVTAVLLTVTEPPVRFTNATLPGAPRTPIRCCPRSSRSNAGSRGGPSHRPTPSRGNCPGLPGESLSTTRLARRSPETDGSNSMSNEQASPGSSVELGQRRLREKSERPGPSIRIRPKRSVAVPTFDSVTLRATGSPSSGTTPNDIAVGARPSWGATATAARNRPGCWRSLPSSESHVPRSPGVSGRNRTRIAQDSPVASRESTQPSSTSSKSEATSGVKFRARSFRRRSPRLVTTTDCSSPACPSRTVPKSSSATETSARGGPGKSNHSRTAAITRATSHSRPRGFFRRA